MSKAKAIKVAKEVKEVEMPMMVTLKTAIYTKFLTVNMGTYKAEKDDKGRYHLIMDDTVRVMVEAKDIEEIKFKTILGKAWVANIIYENGGEVFLGITRKSVEDQVYDWVKNCWESEYRYSNIVMPKVPLKAIKQYFDIATEAGDCCSCDIMERNIYK